MRTVSVITGGAGGMGLATARLLGREHLAVISDRDEDRLRDAQEQLRGAGVECVAVPCDITDPGSVTALAARASELGDVRSVVHTAGVSPTMGGPELIYRVNALGTLNVGRAFLPLARPGFSLVNVASTAGHLSAGFPVPKRAYRLAHTDPEQMLRRLLRRNRLFPGKLAAGMAYSISKNFVIWYSRELTGPLGAQGARVVSVSPGSFDTAMGRLEDEAGAGDLARHSAFGRYGQVEEIASVLAFCAGGAPGYLTGTDVLVDGGVSVVMTGKEKLALARKQF